MEFAETDGVLEPSEVMAFYKTQGFTPCDKDDPDCEVVYFDNFHAARRSNNLHGDGKWEIYQSKISKWERIEHRLEQVSGQEHGVPSLYFKRAQNRRGEP